MDKKLVTIALITMLSGLPMQALVCDLGAQEQSDRQIQSGQLLNQGLQQYRARQYESAFQSWQSALQIYQEIKDRVGESKVWNNLGLAYYSLGQFAKAVPFFQQRLTLSRELNDRRAEAYALDSLGLNYIQLGQYEQAIAMYQPAIEILSQLNDRKNAGNALGNLGIAYRELGQYAKAIACHQQQLAITREISDRAGEGRALGGLAIVYRELGRYEKAIDLNRQDLAIARELKDLSGQARALNNLGTVYSDLEQYPQAIVLYKQGLEISRSLKDRSGEGRTLGNIGNGYRQLGQYEQAIAFLEQQLTIARNINDTAAEGKAAAGLGIAYNRLRKYEKALDFYQQDLAIARQLKDRNGEGRALNNLGVLLGELKQPELAILYYKQSVNIQESIRRDIRGLSKEEQRSFLGTVAGTYRSLADLLLKQGRVMEALQIIDLLKIQELEDYLQNVKGNERTAQGMRILEPESKISRLSTVSFAQIPLLNRELAQQIQQIAPSELNKAPAYLQKLPQGVVLIYPLVLLDRLEIVIFAANSIPTARTVAIAKPQLEEMIADFRNDLQDPSSYDIKTSAKKLYEILIKPIESDLKQAKAKTILYAPDGILRYIPLATLYDGKHWLVERYRINNLISYSLLDRDRQSLPDLTILAGAFGGKAGESKFGLSGLPSSITEVENIASTFPKANKYIEQNFTSQMIRDKAAGNAIIHLATHAEFKNGSPFESYLLFGDGSKLTLAEVNDLKLQDTQLVVLSACQTGLGSLGTGTEILGFGYQVHRAGARASIASLWKVSDGGTQILMSAFYNNLRRANSDTSIALREAQLSMVKPSAKGGVNYSHPYFWSSFVLISNSW
ncbi:CHAT domain-containing protein [Pseudanabaena sp. UWO310]|uniref:CHAT domain-containing protein n=1 Tax=Pseudanabaena sp. UWO310 TaxID=2480795 RepID=UPI00115A6A36|nr:CHAT domain-containing protein [Pseudanabaena sp. UWO310]TYQ31999.1 tetratricopeptide repeat protein [Pseudanabaena sp. UWO310]